MASVMRPLGNVAQRGHSEQQFVEWQDYNPSQAAWTPTFQPSD